MKTQFKITAILAFVFSSATISYAQEQIKGAVKTTFLREGKEQAEPIVGANVYWDGTTSGVATNANGAFNLGITVKLPHKLIISYVGFISDTILVQNPQQPIKSFLKETRELGEVTVKGRAAGAHYSKVDPILTNVVSEKELQKAACCNLSEAFETNPSVDVSYSDAVTGAKQIQLLGLAGTYSQMLAENMPTLRGLGMPFGMSFIPGPWMESIQVSKGTSSVVNGFDAITGQINVELKKPENSERIGLNLYINSFGRAENSLILSKTLNYKWSTILMTHVEYLGNKIDHNHDSFLDHPLIKKYHITNRYHYLLPGVMESQFGFRFMQEQREGGQVGYFGNNSQNYYGLAVNTNRFEATARTGFFFQNQPEGSVGTQVNYIYHEHDAFYGANQYKGKQNTVYVNIIYENIIKTKDHKINAGISNVHDSYNETFSAIDNSHKDIIPGLFGQYTFHLLEKHTGIIGMRGDWHNEHGLFFTPRLHLKSDIFERTTLRGSIGKGYRLPNLLAENTGLMVSNRQFIVQEEIKPEEAWNYGGSIMQTFVLFGNEATLTDRKSVV